MEHLSKDLYNAFLGSKFGCLRRNLWDMRRVYLECEENPKLRPLVAEISWRQNLFIMSKVIKEEAVLPEQLAERAMFESERLVEAGVCSILEHTGKEGL